MRNVYLAKFLVMPIHLCSNLLVILHLFRIRLPRSVVYSASLAGVGFVILRLVLMLNAGDLASIDFDIFWRAGEAMRQGKSPYESINLERIPFNYPPNSLVFLSMLASIPYKPALAAWASLGTILSFALVPLSWISIRIDEAEDRERASSFFSSHSQTLLLLTATTSLSSAFWLAVDVGQPTMIVSFALLAAFACRQASRPILAGILLMVAAIKPHTLVPFLVLFRTRRDLPTWVVLAAGIAVTCVAANTPEQLLVRSQITLTRAGELAAAGQINDYSLQSRVSATVIGLSHGLSRLGLTDRRLIEFLQHAVFAMLVAWSFFSRKASRWSEAATASVVCIFCTLFLYHRIYDCSILAFPITYTAVRSTSEVTRARNLYRFSCILLLAAINPSGFAFMEITARTEGLGAFGNLIRGATLPFVTWTTLGAMLLLIFALHKDAERHA